MATQFALRVAGHPVDRRVVGETALASPRIDGEMSGGGRLAAATVLIVSGVLFLAPPAAALFVLAGLIR